MSVESLHKPAREVAKYVHDHTSAHATHSHHADANDERAPSTRTPSCPHCPDGTSHEDAGAHIACSALDDVADAGGQLGIAKLQLEYVLSIVPTVVFAKIPRVLSPFPTKQTAPPAACAVALHLRHCVFLI
jgi:hypothetical protein